MRTELRRKIVKDEALQGCWQVVLYIASEDQIKGLTN